MSKHILEIIKEFNDSLTNYNDMSYIINGSDHTAIPLFPENEQDEVIYRLHIHIKNIKDIVDSNEGPSYKSKASDTSKQKFTELLKRTKEIINKSLAETDNIIYDTEKEKANTIFKDVIYNSSLNLEEKILQLNAIIKNESAYSSVSSMVANKLFNSMELIEKDADSEDVIRFIVNSNIKLYKIAKRLLFNGVLGDEKDKPEHKNVYYGLNINLRIFQKSNILQSQKCLYNFLGLEITNNKYKEINIDLALEDEEFMISLCNFYKNTYNRNLHIFYGKYTDNKKVIDDDEFIYNPKRLFEGDEIDVLSGINKKYVEKTKTISMFKDKELLEDYVCPLSLKNQSMKCYNWIDIFNSSANYSLDDVFIVVKKSYGIQAYNLFKLYKNVQLFYPEMLQLDNMHYMSKEKIYEENLLSLIPNAFSERKNDIAVYVPLKIGNVRHRILEYLKKYKRVQDKVENTNNLVSIFFNSIYEEIIAKSPEGSAFNDEFYMMFYSSIYRLAFKLRKEMMDRYIIMKDYETAKEEIVKILEKSEKNIIKIDNNLHIIHKITSE